MKGRNDNPNTAVDTERGRSLLCPHLYSRSHSGQYGINVCFYELPFYILVRDVIPLSMEGGREGRWVGGAGNK